MVKNIPSDHKRISREIGEQGVVPFGQPHFSDVTRGQIESLGYGSQ